MSFSSSLLGKNLDALVAQDIENFFQVPREENNRMEFKSLNIRTDDNKLLTLY